MREAQHRSFVSACGDMMHLIRKYDVAPLCSAMMRCLPLCARRHTSFAKRTSLGEAVIICRRQTSLKKAIRFCEWLFWEHSDSILGATTQKPRIDAVFCYVPRSSAVLTAHRAVIHCRASFESFVQSRCQKEIGMAIAILSAGQKDSILGATTQKPRIDAVFCYAPRSGGVLTCHRHVIHCAASFESFVQSRCQKEIGMAIAIPISFWQGQKDSNPRPLVLETSTLPTELYPCAQRIL